MGAVPGSSQQVMVGWRHATSVYGPTTTSTNRPTRHNPVTGP
ncbi:hypothetical protein ACLQ24_02260 [Micromonospora sp. DT4]